MEANFLATSLFEPRNKKAEELDRFFLDSISKTSLKDVIRRLLHLSVDR